MKWYRTGRLRIKFLIVTVMTILLATCCVSPKLSNCAIHTLPPLVSDSWVDFATNPLGTGTQAAPYQITTPNHLAWLSANAISMTGTIYIEILADIDLGEHEWQSISNANLNFVINGNRFVISEIIQNRENEPYMGLVGDCRSVNIQNLSIANAYVVASQDSAIMVGHIHETGIFKNCQVSGYCTAKFTVGGIVGYCENLNMNNCKNYATISQLQPATYVFDGEYHGGLVGLASGIVSNSQNFGNVRGYRYVGGIAGGTRSSLSISNCYSEGDIEGYDYIGGLAGSASNIHLSGFNGGITTFAENPVSIGTLIAISSPDCDLICQENFAIAAVEALQHSGDINLLIASGVVSFQSCYTYFQLTTKTEFRTARLYKISADETPFSEWTYSAYVNGGFPFPKGMFAVGNNMGNRSVMYYLNESGFKLWGLPLLQDSFGNHYYELGSYPQTYIGNNKNTVLESWYKTQTPTGQFHFSNYDVTNVYTYLDGKRYVRMDTNISDTSYTKNKFENGENLFYGYVWMRVEPIRWIVLNYEDTLHGVHPIVIADRCLSVCSYDDNTVCYTYEYSGVRKWLNEYFYQEAFTPDERIYINETILQNNSAGEGDGSAGSTVDNVWLLSKDEQTDLIVPKASPSDAALAQIGTYSITANPSLTRTDGAEIFNWLRTIHAVNEYDSTAYCARSSGFSYDYVAFAMVNSVRPCLTLL